MMADIREIMDDEFRHSMRKWKGIPGWVEIFVYEREAEGYNMQIQMKSLGWSMERFYEILQECIDKSGIVPKNFELIAFHLDTVWHHYYNFPN